MSTSRIITPIAAAIELARKDAEDAHMAQARKAASWCERWGRFFDDESFEEGLLIYERLTLDDRQALRTWRADMIEERCLEQRAT